MQSPMAYPAHATPTSSWMIPLSKGYPSKVRSVKDHIHFEDKGQLKALKLFYTHHDEENMTITFGELKKMKSKVEETLEGRRRRKRCHEFFSSFTKAKRTSKRFYRSEIHEVGKGGEMQMRFSCLTNYHHLDGDMIMTCLPNNTVIGKEPSCAVNPTMSKNTLSFYIAFTALLFPALWLFIDFIRFKKDRLDRRGVSKKAFTPRCRVNGLRVHRSQIGINQHNFSMESSNVDEDMVINMRASTAMRPSTRLSEGTVKKAQMMGVVTRTMGKVGKELL